MRSHQSIALVGLLALAVSLIASVWIRSHTTRLTSLRNPIVSNSTLALSGLQRSLAGVRGWMVLEDSAFKTERAFAWDSEIIRRPGESGSPRRGNDGKRRRRARRQGRKTARGVA